MKDLRRSGRRRRVPWDILRVAALALTLVLLVGWAALPGDAGAVGGTTSWLTLSPRPTGTTSQPVATPRTNPSPAPTPSQTIQSMVDAAAPGAVVSVPAGIYREAVSITKPLTLVGQPGAEIRGSDVWTGWTWSGAYWVRGTVPTFPSSDAPCLDASNGRCDWPEQVFFDGKPLLQVAANPGSGQFAVDDTRRVVLADDPSGHTVEVTTRQYWILGLAGNVTIQGFTMKHAASPSQLGAIENNGHANWTIQNNTLSDTAGAVVFLNDASGLQVLSNDIARGGQEGLSLDSTSGAVIRGNRIHDNNTELFATGWEAGGAKITRASGTVADGNTIDSNTGIGLWFDMNCSDTTITNNRVHHNSRTGISYEISHTGRISGNALWENGWDKPSKWGDTGLLLNCADNTDVSNNVLAWNSNGIEVMSQDRPDSPPVVGNFVHDNVIAATDDFSPGNRYALQWLQDWYGQLYDPAANNHGANNQYWYPTIVGSVGRFEWSSSYTRLADFNQTRGEHNGVYISSAQKDRTLAAAGVPTVQEQH